MPDTKSPEEKVVDQKPKLDAEGQQVMEAGLRWDTAVSPGPDMTDEDAHALYNKLYGAEASEDNQLPNVDKSFYFNGKERRTLKDPEPEAEVGKSYDPNFTPEEMEMIKRVAKPPQEVMDKVVPVPEGTPTDSEVSHESDQIAALKAEIEQLKTYLVNQQGTEQPIAPPQPASDQSKESVEQDLQTLDTILKNRFGLTLPDVYNKLSHVDKFAEYINGVQAQQKVASMTDELKNKWGDDFDFRYAEAKKVYDTLSDDDKSAFDKLGVRGAEMLWDSAAQRISQEPDVPNFDRGKSFSRTPDKEEDIITQDYLLSLSEQEYAKQMLPGGKLWQAAKEGRIKYDI